MSRASTTPAIAPVLRTLASLWSPLHFRPTEPTATLPYGPPRPGRPPLADIVLPVRPTGASAVLVHGGGFVIGSRRMKPIRFLATRLAERGIATCAIDYRLLGRGGRLAEATADVVTATRFWSEDGMPRFALDPSRITLVGLSAGGALVLLAADEAPVQQVAGIFGLYDFSHLTGRVAQWIPRIACGSASRSDWLAASPISQPLTQKRLLLLHGTEDGLSPVSQAEAMAAARQAHALPTELEILEGAPHAFFNTPGPFAEQGLDLLARFIGG